MTINWQELWNSLRSRLSAHAIWERRQIIDLMNRIEQDAIQKEPMYGIGVEYAGSVDFGMTHGPTPDLASLLDVIPSDPNSVIILL